MRIEETEVLTEEKEQPEVPVEIKPMTPAGSGSDHDEHGIKVDGQPGEAGKGTTDEQGGVQVPGLKPGESDGKPDQDSGEGDGEQGEQKPGDGQPGEQEGSGQGEQGEQHEMPKIDPSIFEKVMSGMTEDQKMEFLSNLPPCFDEDQIRRIAYAVFQQEYSGIAEEIDILTNRMINRMDSKAKETLANTEKSATELIEEVKRQLKNIGKPKVIDAKIESGEIKHLGLVHHETEWLIKALKKPRNIFLSGPAGSGKTTCAEKVAEALGLSFHPISVGPETMKSDLLGFIDGNGNYHTTQIREAFEKGGLLLLDEIDAGNGASITILNALLANGYCSFPDGVVKRHPNFRCVAAANTFGRGSDRLYVGRNQLDAATLDRFVVRAFDYDETLERQLAGNDKWVDRVLEIRHKAEELKLRVVVSPRASIVGASMLEDGFSQSDVEEALIFKYDKEFKRKING